MSTFKLYSESNIKPAITLNSMEDLLDYATYESGAILLDAGQYLEITNFIDSEAVGSVNWSSGRKHLSIDGKALMYVIEDGKHDIYIMTENFEDCSTVSVTFKGSMVYRHIAEKLNRTKEA